MKKQPRRRRRVSPQTLDLRSLVSKATLVAIDTVRISAERVHAPWTHGELPDLPAGATLNVRLSMSHPRELRADSNAFVAELTCPWFVEGHKHPAAQMTIELRLSYAFAGLDSPPSQELANEFLAKVVAHHAWPFLRERAKTLSTEIGVGVVVLPLKHLTPQQ